MLLFPWQLNTYSFKGTGWLSVATLPTLASISKKQQQQEEVELNS